MLTRSSPGKGTGGGGDDPAPSRHARARPRPTEQLCPTLSAVMTTCSICAAVTGYLECGALTWELLSFSVIAMGIITGDSWRHIGQCSLEPPLISHHPGSERERLNEKVCGLALELTYRSSSLPPTRPGQGVSSGCTVFPRTKARYVPGGRGRVW